jgi:hypothetical protein
VAEPIVIVEYNPAWPEELVVEPDDVRRAIDRLVAIGCTHEGNLASIGGRRCRFPWESPGIITTSTSPLRTARSCGLNSRFATGCGAIRPRRPSTRL